MLDLLAEARDSAGTAVLGRVAKAVWWKRRSSRRLGVMTHSPAGTWGGVFALAQDLDRSMTRCGESYLRPESNIPLEAATTAGGVKIPKANIVIRDDKITITILDRHSNSLFRPLTILPDGSAVSTPDTREYLFEVLDGLERGDAALREALVEAFRHPRTQRRIVALPIYIATAERAPAGSVPESIIRASPLLQNLTDDMGLSPAGLFEQIPVDPVARDSLLATMDAWLTLPKDYFRFMPDRAAEVANLAHFLGIDSMCDWIVENVGELMSVE